MVTTRLVGYYGNQLFQIAAVIGYARRHNMDYRIPLSATAHWPAYHIDGISYGNVDTGNMVHYKEDAIHYDRRPYNIRYKDIPYYPNILLEGHFQSEKFFEHCRQEVIELFSFPNHDKMFKGCVSIHVRRGDYLTMAGHLPVVTVEYLSKAIEYFVEKGYHSFYVFGNDDKWNRENLNEGVYGHLSAQIVFYHVHSDVRTDMLTASMCEHNIGSNSSYSIWISLLNRNPDKICIFPETWFGPAYGTVDTADLYPANSIRM